MAPQTLLTRSGNELTGQTFPVEYSTLSCEALVQHVLSQYSIASVLSCRLWNRGLSDVYLVETRDSGSGLRSNRPYILRVTQAHWRTKAEVEFELSFLDCLRQHEHPVAYPFLTQEGQLHIEIEAPEGKRYASLFLHAPGEIPLCDLSVPQSRKLGQQLAQIHAVTPKFRPPCHRQSLTLDYLLHQSIDALLPFFGHRPEEQEYLNQLRIQLEQSLSQLPQDSPYWVVCWGDPHSGNVHFTPDGQLTLFDFDQCGYGWRAFDIAKFFQTSLRTGMSYAVRNAFLEGYESVLPLHKQELQLLPELVQVAHLWGWAIRLKAAQIHSYNQLDGRYFNQRLHQLKSFRQHNWQLF